MSMPIYSYIQYIQYMVYRPWNTAIYGIYPCLRYPYFVPLKRPYIAIYGYKKVYITYLKRGGLGGLG